MNQLSCTTMNPCRNKNKKKNKLAIFFKSKLLSKKQKKDAFIKKYVQWNRSNVNVATDIQSLDLRRKIFVSLVSLCQGWKRISPSTLYSSLFLLPLKKDWIFNPSKYSKELEHHSMETDILSDSEEMIEFRELLKWKDSHGLAFWMLEEYKSESDETNPLIHPFWIHLNDKLTKLYDPITGHKYKSLNFDESLWQSKDYFQSKFNVKVSNVLSELYFCTMKFSTMQEILFQSNPESLHPITGYYSDSCVPLPIDTYKLYVCDGKTDSVPVKKHCQLTECQKEDKSDIWWISDDYDPYELDC